MQRQAGRQLQAIQLVFFGFGEIVVARLDDYVTSRTRATAAAGMFQMEARIHSDVQEGFGFAMFMIRQLPGFELHGLVVIDKGYFGHTFILTSRVLRYW